MRSRVSVVSKCPKCFKMSNFACRVGACHTCATLASPCVTNWYQQFFYRALASIFSVFVEASVVVNKGRVVVSTLSIRTTQHVVIYRVVMNIRVVTSYPLSADVYRCL